MWRPLLANGVFNSSNPIRLNPKNPERGTWNCIGALVGRMRRQRANEEGSE
jgi:hypothetical protein